jgi:hypothetical protein
VRILNYLFSFSFDFNFDFDFVEYIFICTEQKKQKISEIRAGLEDAESLVPLKNS